MLPGSYQFSGDIRNKRTNVVRSFNILVFWGGEETVKKELSSVYSGGDVKRLEKEFYIQYDVKGRHIEREPNGIDDEI